MTNDSKQHAISSIESNNDKKAPAPTDDNNFGLNKDTQVQQSYTRYVTYPLK